MKLLRSMSFLVAVFLASSCSDPVFVTQKYPVPKLEKEPTHEQEVAYTQAVFDILGQAIGEASLNPKFRTFVYSEVGKKFDGESNVLIKELASSEEPATSRLFNDALSRTVGGKSQANEVLAAFAGVDHGQTAYPHLFIPFYDELTIQKRIGVSEPIIVPAALSDTPDFKGYRATETGLVEVDFRIDEEFARTNEVWVITMNERVDGQGRYWKLNDQASAGFRTKASADGRYGTMTVNQHKEEWAAGASEINTKRVLSFWTYDYWSPDDPQSAPVDDVNQGQGAHIRDFSRSEIDNHTPIALGWVYIDDWPERTMAIGGVLRDTDHIAMILFEYDPWPVGEYYHWLGDAGNSGDQVYSKCRSSDGPYHAFIIARSAPFYNIQGPGNAIFTTCDYY
jgi:hypothetical protein